MKSGHYEDREQSEVKHQLLERYLKAAVPILGTWASDFIYVDCLAGPWESSSPQYLDTSFGRAIRVLKETQPALASRGQTPSIRALLSEVDPEAFAKLKEFSMQESTPHLPIRAEKWDLNESTNRIVSVIREKPNTFPFIFIDPKGWNLARISLLRPLLKLNPGEVLINLMTSWIRRFLSDESKHFEDLLGPGYKSLLNFTGDEQEEELVKVYADAVRHAGNFPYVCSMPVMKASQDAFHFHLIYATRHPKGVEEFKRAERVVIPFMHATRAEAQRRREFEQTGQYSMLAPAETYSERRFTRLRARNLATANDAVKQALRMATTEFDAIWAIAMQFAAVEEDDLLKWIFEWEKDGKLHIQNPAPAKGKLKRGRQHQLIWIRNS